MIDRSEHASLPDNACLDRLRPTDLPGLVTFEANANPDAWSSALLESALVDSDHWVWGLFIDGELCAVAIVAWLPFDAELQSISVLPSRRRRGLAAALLAAIGAHAASHGCERLLLEVRAANEAAQALYQRCGFAVDGRRKGYYRRADGSGEDAVLMSCDLKR